MKQKKAWAGATVVIVAAIFFGGILPDKLPDNSPEQPPDETESPMVEIIRKSNSQSDTPDTIETSIVTTDITFDIDTTEPNWWSLVVDSDLTTTGSITSGVIDPNTRFIIWVQPLYDCPTHGEVDEVATFSGGRNACVECFFDVFPPLEKVAGDSSF